MKLGEVVVHYGIFIGKNPHTVVGTVKNPKSKTNFGFIFEPATVHTGILPYENSIVYYNFTKFHQNQMKNIKIFINILFFCFLNSLIFAKSLLNDPAP